MFLINTFFLKQKTHMTPRKIYKQATAHKKMIKINSHQISANGSHDRYHFLPTVGKDKEQLEL